MKSKLATLCLLCLFFGINVFSQDCEQKFKDAEASEKRGEYLDALRKFNAARKCDGSLNEPCEEKIEAMFKKINGLRKDSEIARKIALDAVKEAQTQTLIAEEEKKRAEGAFIEVDSSRRKISQVLESLGKFSEREYYLKIFNTSKEKGDDFYTKEVWDSSYIYYKFALDAADASPFMQVNKKNIYKGIEESRKKLDIQNNIRQRVQIADTLSNRGGFINYARAFDIYCEIIDNSNYKEYIKTNMVSFSDKIENELDGIDMKSIDRETYAIMYLFIELNHFLEIKPGKNEEIKKDLIRKRKAHSIISTVYESYHLQQKFKSLLNEIGNQTGYKYFFEIFYSPGYTLARNNGYNCKNSYGVFFSESISKYTSKKYFVSYSVEFRKTNGYSRVIDTVNFVNSKGYTINIDNAVKENEIDFLFVSNICSFNYFSNNLSKNKNNRLKINLGLNLGLSVYDETISNNRKNIIKDSDVFSTQMSEFTYTTKNNLEKESNSYLAFLGGGQIRLLYNKNSRRTIYTGIRYSNYTPWLSKEENLYYKDLRQRLGIISGNNRSSLDFILGFTF